MNRMSQPALLCLITAVLHLTWIADTVMYMNDAPDFFLISSLVLALGYLIFLLAACRNKTIPWWIPALNIVGTALQLLLFAAGIIKADNGAFGLGGGGFAQFYFSAGLIVFCVLLILIALAKKLLEHHLK